MLQARGGDTGEVVRYRRLVDAMDDGGRLHAAVRDELAAIERLEGRLASLSADPRVARRLRREARERGLGAHLGRPLMEAVGPPGLPPVRRRGFRPPSKATAERWVAMIDDLEALDAPRTVADLARLQARLAGAPGTAPFRSDPALVRGTTRTLAGPDPSRVVAETQRVLDWGAATDTHPVVKAAGVAGALLSVRPFKQDEPLLGRLLMRSVLHANGLGSAAEVALDARFDLGDSDTVDHLIEAVAREDPLFWVRHTNAMMRASLEQAVFDARFAARYVDTLNERQWRLVQWFQRMAARGPDTTWRFREVHTVFDQVPARTLKRDLATLRGVGLLEMEGRLKSARYRWTDIAPRSPSAT